MVYFLTFKEILVQKYCDLPNIKYLFNGSFRIRIMLTFDIVQSCFPPCIFLINIILIFVQTLKCWPAIIARAFFPIFSSSVKWKHGLSYASMFNRGKFQPSIRHPNKFSFYFCSIFVRSKDSQNFLSVISWRRPNLRTLFIQLTISLMSNDL